MEYRFDNNGIEVVATYSDREINEIFLPLLNHLGELHSEKSARLLVMLAAPPGAGKSTIASFLEYLAKDALPDKKFQAIGMDGFHRRQEYLTSHTADVGGKEVLMVDIKGAPVTFDLERLKEKIKKAVSEKCCGWPVYNRLLHDPVEDAVLVDGDIIILEGNYLLLDEAGWKDISDLADFAVSIDADPEMLRDRLIKRKISTGCTKEKAMQFVDFSDMANVAVCLEKTKKADVELLLSNDNGYSVIRTPGRIWSKI